ncbi:MAG: ABC transporter permease, partial [bacterium]
MYAYIFRKLLYNVPVYLGIILFVMVALRVNDPVMAYLGKSASPESIAAMRSEMGLDRPLISQYGTFLGRVVTLDFSERSWEQKRPVGDILGRAVWPSLAITVPALILSTLTAISIALLSAYWRGTLTDRTLMFAAVLGMSVSLLVYVVLGQYFGAYWLPEKLGIPDGSPLRFAISGYEPVVAEGLRPDNWLRYCLLPVIITVVLTIGYD